MNKYLLFGIILIPTYGQNQFSERPLQPATPIIIEKAIDNHVDNIAETIKHVETGGNYNAKGDSGEIGAYQILGATWKGMAGNIPMTPVNQDLVVKKELKRLVVSKGYSVADIALKWNQGHRGACRRGVNSKGVRYDSCGYKDKVLNEYYKRIATS